MFRRAPRPRGGRLDRRRGEAGDASLPVRGSGSATVRRFLGRKALETFLHVRPGDSEEEIIEVQARRACEQIHRVLTSRGPSLPSVVREVVFFRDIASDLERYLIARRGELERLGISAAYQPVSTFIQQPPLAQQARFEILLAAITPLPGASSQVRGVETAGANRKPSCVGSSRRSSEARVLLLDGEKHVFAGNLHGEPGDVYDETLSMFRGARDILRREGIGFHSVARTWIYFRHMWRDYAGFNRARRDFFHEEGLDTRPASTGINGGPFPPECNLCMSFHAVQSPTAEAFHIMTTPTLNEAWEYGSDFSRGLRVHDSNKATLYVSGTASINEQGETVHLDDFDAQVDRTLLNISELLRHQGASLEDVVSATSYVKRRSDAQRFLQLMASKGLDRFPHAMVEAGVCRENLLVEIEVTALLRR